MKQIKKLQKTFTCVVLLLGVSVVNARAQTDTDLDGFANEAQGVTFFNGTSLPACVAGSVRTVCVDPLTPDVFVILVPAAGGRFQNLVDPLRVLRNLNRPNTITGVHQITPAQANAQRQISPSSTQKAIRITENLATKSAGTNKDGIWGSSIKQGTPNLFGGGVATVYTSQIAADITAYFAGQAVPAGLIDNCIRHTIAHEAGHNVAIAAQPDPTLTGSHYSTTQQVVMSKGPLFTRVGTAISVSCASLFASPDLTGFRLK
jgi:hypothetical protein